MTREPRGEWWAGIIHQFEAHVREERVFLEAYENALSSARDPGIRFLLRAVLEDERRHHALFEEMSAAARGEGDALPEPPEPDPGVARTLLDATERFLDAERDDQRSLRRLRKELKPAREGTMWPLLVELMELDTEKHIRILEYLRDRLHAAKEG